MTSRNKMAVISRIIDPIFTIIAALLLCALIYSCDAGVNRGNNGNLLKGFSSQRPRPDQSKHGRMHVDDSSVFRQLGEMAGLGPLNSFRLADDVNNIPPSAKGVKRVRLIQTYGGYDVFGASVEAEINLQGEFTGQMSGDLVFDLENHISNPEACKRSLNQMQLLAIDLAELQPNDELIDVKVPARLIFAQPGLIQARIAYKVELLFGGDVNITRPIYFFDACTRDLLLKFDWLGMKTESNERGPKEQQKPQKPQIPQKPQKPQKTPKPQKPQKPQNPQTPQKPPKPQIPQKPQKPQKLKSFEEQEEVNIEMKESDCPVYAAGVGGNEKIGKIHYNVSPRCLNVKKQDSDCSMEGTYVKVVDNSGSRSKSRSTPVRFKCNTGYNDAINGAYGVANDAFYHGEATGRFLEEVYQYRPFSYIPRIVVHYGKRFENAFWNGRDMFMGDGHRRYYPFVDIDTVAHEIGHAVTNFNSDLVYSKESGGINEAFSDIMGETAKFYLRKSNDWLISYDTWKSTPDREAQRFFEDPSLDGVSIKHVDDYFDSIDVHYSSGIFNRAFYGMVKIEGMAIYDAFKCFFDANRNLWQPFTDFSDGACHVMQAAYDNGFNHTKVKEAFKPVGIFLDDCNFSALTTVMLKNETREHILVSKTRSPVLKIDFDSSEMVTLVVDTNEGDVQNVILKVGNDELFSSVIAIGTKSVEFDASDLSYVYVELSSNSNEELIVSLTVS